MPFEDYRPIMQFEDRADYRVRFEEVLDNIADNEPNILVYHGMGGIGKSAFRRELERILEAKRNGLHLA